MSDRDPHAPHRLSWELRLLNLVARKLPATQRGVAVFLATYMTLGLGAI